MLTKGSSIKGVRFTHALYWNWSWIAQKNLDNEFFEAMKETLNDDCIREMIKHMDLLHLFYFAHINKRFEVLAMEKLSRLRIFPSTVGTIGLMNLRYMLEKIGISLKEISISLSVFPTIFDFYFEGTKRDILEVICACGGKDLKQINFHDFKLTDSETKNLDYIMKLFSARCVDVKFY